MDVGSICDSDSGEQNENEDQISGYTVILVLEINRVSLIDRKNFGLVVTYDCSGFGFATNETGEVELHNTNSRLKEDENVCYET